MGCLGLWRFCRKLFGLGCFPRNLWRFSRRFGCLGGLWSLLWSRGLGCFGNLQ